MQTPSWSRCLLLLACLPATALAADQAGVSAAVRGQVILARAQAVGLSMRSGESIFMQDKIKSGPQSGMQILLLDQTTFTIGPESEIEVDEFVYDPKTDAGKLSARVAKGVFRFVTGKIAKQEPSNMNVALPTGNIGIRGTMVAGSVDPVTRGSLVVLLGEGVDNASGDPAGAIDVCNAGACTQVSRPGFGVRIDGVEAPPSPAFRVETAEVDSILQAVNGPESGVKNAIADARDEDVDPGPIAVEDVNGDRQHAKEIRRRLASLDLVDFVTDMASQDKQIEDVRDSVQKLSGIPDGPTLFEQMLSIPNGQIHYVQFNTPLTGGSYDISINVDFGARTYGGGQSQFSVQGAQNGVQFLTAPQSYANSTGVASFVFNSTAITGVGCGTNCTAVLKLNPQNVNGVIAGVADHSLVLKNFAGVVVNSGSGVAPGQPGLAP